MVATRFVVDQTGPASLALLRYAIGVACLAPLVFATAPRVRFARADLLPIALLGTVQFGVLIALLNYGLRFVPSARAALIFATFPLLTMLLAVALRHERLSAMRSLGVLATIAGVAVALGDKALAPGSGGGDWIGELAVLGSALCGAVCSVLYRPYVARYPALPMSAFAMLASVVFLAVLAVPEGFFDALPRFTPAGWAAVLFIGVGSGAGYYLWLWALRHASATEVTAFLSLSPFTAACLGAWLLGETLSASAAVGVVLVAAGLYLAYRAPRPTSGGRRPGSTSAERCAASPRP
jgi:drug/metabolite transporter (DMT)-like permease